MLPDAQFQIARFLAAPSFCPSRPQQKHRLVTLLTCIAFLPCVVPMTCHAQSTAHFAGIETVIGTHLSECFGVAVDGGGNVYIADTYNNRILKETPSVAGYTQSVVAIGLNTPYGVAVDAHGNLYVADTYNFRIVKETLSAGSYIPSVVVSSLTTTPWEVAVDRSGSVYFASNNQILKETPSGNGYTQTVIANAANNGLNDPWEVAVDAQGDVYITDNGNNRVVLERLSAGAYTQSTVATGLDFPSGIAVDASDNVYVANAYTDQILKETLTGGSYTQSVLPTGPLSFPYELAVDQSGNVYIANPQAGNVLKKSPISGSFGTVNIGSQSSTLSMVFAFDTAGRIGAPAVVTQGTPNLDFADTGGGSCTTNGTSVYYAAGDTCLLDVLFVPKSPGSRYGAGQLEDGSGNVIAAGYLQGTGKGPQVTFSPGRQTTITDSLQRPEALAVDAWGNIYVSSAFGAPAGVYREAPSASGYTQTLIVGGLNYPTGVAVDGSGVVYVSDTYNQRVLKETPAGTGYLQSTIGSGFGDVFGVAVDGSGNVYILNASQVLKETLTASGYVQSVVSASGLLQAIPTGIAVDGSGNVFVAVANGNLVLKETPVGSTYTETEVANFASNGLNQPMAVTVDAVGNLYIADAGNARVLKEAPSESGYIQSVVTTGSLAFPVGIAFDSAGNLIITDVGTDDRVLTVEFAHPLALNFAATVVGKTSSNSPQTVTVHNIGNDNLVIPAPATGNNPSISPNFTWNGNAASACKVAQAHSSKVVALAPGASCTLPISFTPRSKGVVNGALVLSDNSLNAHARQTITLAGTGEPKAAPAATWIPPAAEEDRQH